MLQNCADQRKAAQISLLRTSSEKQTAQHRENLRRNSLGNYKSAALSHQAALDINRALEQLRVIEVIRAGDQRPGGKASEFRYLLSQSENGAEEDAGFDL